MELRDANVVAGAPEVPDLPTPVLTGSQVPLSLRAQELLQSAMSNVPPGGHGALIGFADMDGSLHTAVAMKIGDHWTIGARFEKPAGSRRPSGGVAVEASW